LDPVAPVVPEVEPPVVPDVELPVVPVCASATPADTPSAMAISAL